MISWLRGLACKHKWKIIKENRLMTEGNVIGMVYYQQCEHCGKIQRKEMY